jgi:hypothetical protein
MCAPLVQIVREIVPSVAVLELARAHVENAAEERHEHARFIVTADFRVQTREDLARGPAAVRCGSEQRLGHRHEERGRHTLAGDISDRKAEVVFIDEEEVIQIPATSLAGTSVAKMSRSFRCGKAGNIFGTMLSWIS